EVALRPRSRNAAPLYRSTGGAGAVRVYRGSRAAHAHSSDRVGPVAGRKMTQLFVRRCVIAGLIVSGVTAGLEAGGAAAPSGSVELEAIDNVTGAISVDDTGSRAPIEARRGNPLWAIPLTDLSATRER